MIIYRGIMDQAELRKAEPGDERILAYIQTESWKAAFSGILSAEELKKSTDINKAEEMYKKVLSRGTVNLIIGSVDEKAHCIAGWSQNRNGLGQDTAELICIHSLPDKWRQGYGSIMMRRIFDDIKRAGFSRVVLWVFEKNLRARGFYEKHGFAVTDSRAVSHGAVEMMYLKEL